MSFENRNYAYSGAFVDELARCGLRHVCICPGSRSSPLTISLARHPKLKTWVHLDERSASFFALGMSKALGEPVGLVCTSGTASANFLPAVVEARYAEVPLLVLTSDRPPEMWEWRAPQTIDQTGIYGSHAKWSVNMVTPEVNPELLRYVRSLACRVYATAVATPAGPVHVNAPFREPLTPIGAPGDFPKGIEQAAPEAWQGRSDGRPFFQASSGEVSPDPTVLRRLAADLRNVEQGIILCGPSSTPDFPTRVTQLAARLGYPVLADPLSQVRAGRHDKSLVVANYDTFLKDPSVASSLEPYLVLRFGDLPLSRPLTIFLENAQSARQIVVRSANWSDPGHQASDIIHAEPSLVCQGLSRSLGEAKATTTWLKEWLRVESTVNAAVDAHMEELDELFEGKIFRELAELLPESGTIFAGNSMPVRDLDTFFPPTDKAVLCMGNRGANGIDGVVSTALGASTHGSGPLVLVLGDLSFYHDMNGLLAAKRYHLNATIIAINNDGGGIFSFLPQADYPDVFEEYFGTPHGLEFRSAAKLYGLPYTKVASWREFRAAVIQSLTSPKTAIIEVPGNRARNVELHRQLCTAVIQILHQKGMS